MTHQIEHMPNSGTASSTQPQIGLWIALAPLSAVTLAGLPYYVLSTAGRVRSPLHDWFKPSGYVGQSAGILALVLFLFIWIYPLRKRIRFLAGLGSLRGWLDAHMLAGLTLPLLGAIHASWKFEGLIGLGYLSMLVVCASGVVGRYIYTRIPRARDGLELTLEQIERERGRLVARIAAVTGLRPDEVDRDLVFDVPSGSGLGPLRTSAYLLTGDILRWRASRQLRRRWKRLASGFSRAELRQALRLARRQMALNHQRRMLESTQRLFRFWHVAHLPFAISALGAVLIHVAVVVALGTTWLG